MRKLFFGVTAFFLILVALASCTLFSEPEETSSVTVLLPGDRSLYGQEDVSFYTLQLFDMGGKECAKIDAHTGGAAVFDQVEDGTYKVLVSAFSSGLEEIASGTSDFFTVENKKDTAVSVTMKALEYFTLSLFNFNNDGKPKKIKVTAGKEYTLPYLFMDDYVFDRWYKDENFTELANSRITVDRDMSLYVKWKTLNQEIADGEDGETFELVNNFTISAPIIIDKDTILTGTGSNRIIRAPGFTSGSMFQVSTGCSLTLADITVDGNKVQNDGSAIYVPAGGNVYLAGSHVINCQSTSQGAIYFNYTDNLTVFGMRANSSIRDNTLSDATTVNNIMGAALDIENSSTTISIIDSVISGNCIDRTGSTATAPTTRGCAVYLGNRANAKIENTTFSGNTAVNATIYGNDVFLSDNAVLRLAGRISVESDTGSNIYCENLSRTLVVASALTCNPPIKLDFNDYDLGDPILSPDAGVVLSEQISNFTLKNTSYHIQMTGPDTAGLSN